MNAILDQETEPVLAVALGSLHRGARGVVVEVVDAQIGLGDEAQSTLARRLIEIGFVPGEHYEVVAETWPGGDPMAVRIGNTIFALRRREANAILVRVGDA